MAPIAKNEVGFVVTCSQQKSLLGKKSAKFGGQSLYLVHKSLHVIDLVGLLKNLAFVKIAFFLKIYIFSERTRDFEQKTLQCKIR